MLRPRTRSATQESRATPTRPAAVASFVTRSKSDVCKAISCAPMTRITAIAMDPIQSTLGPSRAERRIPRICAWIAPSATLANRFSSRSSAANALITLGDDNVSSIRALSSACLPCAVWLSARNLRVICCIASAIRGTTAIVIKTSFGLVLIKMTDIVTAVIGSAIESLTQFAAFCSFATSVVIVDIRLPVRCVSK